MVEVAGVDCHRTIVSKVHQPGAQIQIVAAGEGEIAVPIDGIVGCQGDRGRSLVLFSVPPLMVSVPVLRRCGWLTFSVPPIRFVPPV